MANLQFKLTVQLITMKSRTKLQNNNTSKPLNIESKAKIYVPITIPNNNPPPHPQNLITTTNSNSTNSIQYIKQNSIHSQSDQTLLQLKKANVELKQKQQIYIDKLIKLEEGLEKQHNQFMQLQDLYNQLLKSYKQKQQEISELQLKYRESTRKRQITTNTINLQQNQIQSQPQQIYPKSMQLQSKKQIEQQKHAIQKLQIEIKQYNNKITQLNKTIQRLFAENIYYKNKDKMNDSRASLNSKVFEELGEWQRQADIERQEKIKLDYQNKFLRSRNQDLQNRVNQLQQLVTKKQEQIMKLRQNNIALSRQNSQSRLLRSASRSPHKNDDKQNSNKKSQNLRQNKIVEQLYQQNKKLKNQLQNIKNKQIETDRSTKNQYFIRQQQFYSFSQQQHSNHSSNQSNSLNQNTNKTINKQLFIKVTNNYEVQNPKQKLFIGNKNMNGIQGGQGQGQIQDVPHFADLHNQTDQSLQQLPAQLQIDNLILKNKKKQAIDL